MRVLEYQAYDEQLQDVIHLGGYVNMIKDNRYMLYLCYDEQTQSYSPVSGIYGKVAMSASEIKEGTSVYKDTIQTDYDDIIELHKQIQAAYQQYIR